MRAAYVGCCFSGLYTLLTTEVPSAKGLQTHVRDAQEHEEHCDLLDALHWWLCTGSHLSQDDGARQDNTLATLMQFQCVN
jgi:hypothetical protein